MRTLISKFAGNRNGATAIEYGLIAAFLAAALVLLLPKITGGLDTAFTGVNTDLTTAPPAP